MGTQKYTIVGLGEIVWDLFPERKQLGGAPANFAYMTSLLGDDAKIASRVGRDALGTETIQALKSLHLDTSHLQEDELHPTGTVIVALNADGQPKYEIIERVAWDFLQMTMAGRTCRDKQTQSASARWHNARRSRAKRFWISCVIFDLGPCVSSMSIFDNSFLRATSWINQPDWRTS